ncbi:MULTISPECIES: arabinosyltransferase domain-containing protein [Gordonia]|uniref:Arabinosyltransferase domain-containing protein n=1 Tax=Gordonia hongkongensis TaxID=1701090 RepID=A0ABT6BXX4_9ACTN|nr:MULTISPECIES: arabinosyltransferase domain-containing protein [Gordonia]MDF6102916.1 arabinosyltransferase domain-containing protein [Gordonia hongkongensis]WGJ85902.1 arabinosyltransferase domain-containing protein [Gordonia sp. SMJS1]
MPAQTVRRARIVAIVTGLLGFLLALATPLMPVSQRTAEIDWPQNGQIGSVSAPLIGYTPVDLDVSIPCTAVNALPPGGSVLLSTTPKQAPKSGERGLFIRKTGAADAPLDRQGVEVVIRNVSLVSATLQDMRDQGCREIVVHADSDAVTAEFVGMTSGIRNEDGEDEPLAGTTEDKEAFKYSSDQRPQVTGLFTDLAGPAADIAGLDAHVTIDSRYNTAPTISKWLVVIVGVASTLLALSALAALDSTDGRRHRRIFPARWWRLNARDYVVIGALIVWHMIGPNTSDDGYLLTMSRVAQDSDYTANYFRWYGAPEAPFGWYYQVFGLLSHISVASPWMRLPALLCGILVWLIVSHEVLPRLGRAALTRPMVAWTAAFAFLACWFPFNNGLRPEPIICLGALLTWCSVERAIATGRMLPAAVACLIGAFSIAAGPTGLLAVAALIAGARPMIMALIKRARVVAELSSADTESAGSASGDPETADRDRKRSLRWSFVALIAPILAAGTFVVFVVFSNLTLRSFVEASSMKSALGPSMSWYNEIGRYSALFAFSADGSIARRFAVLAMILGLVVSAAVLVRKNRIPGTAIGPTRRIVAITFASLVFLMFTPTKWTHHFGVFAGIAAALAAIAAIAASQQSMHSRRNRTLFCALVLFIGGLAFTAPNSYYYYSAWGMPWGVEQVKIGGIMLGSVLLYAALALLLVALWFHFREPFTGTDPHVEESTGADAAHQRWYRRLVASMAAAPLAYLAMAVVVFQIVTAIFAGIHQSSSYSVPRSNFAAVAGNPCGMADKVWVESDPDRDMLRPVDPTLPNPLGGPPPAPGSVPSTSGFFPNGVPTALESTASEGSLGVLSGDVWQSPDIVNSNPGGTGGGEIAEPGINGSTAALPFFLDPASTPVMGSYSKLDQVPARLTSGWYALPSDWRDRPLLTMSVAGEYDNPNVMLEYTADPIGPDTRDADLEAAGDTELIDPGPRPSWRNLRYNTDELPSDTTAVRIVATDDNLAEDRFIVLTPPRIPQMDTLQDVVGSTDPVHIDWTSGLAFPCQRPFTHDVGVAEIPKWRIKPGSDLAAAVSAWQNRFGGGPLGWLEVSQQATAVPTYLMADIGRDWGALERYEPYGDVDTLAEIETGTATRSGLWSPAPLRH